MTVDLKNIIETLIFISIEPLSLEKIRNILTDFSTEDIRKSLMELVQDSSQKNRGIQIVQVAGGYMFSTKIEYDPWIRLLLRVDRKNRLSISAIALLISWLSSLFMFLFPYSCSIISPCLKDEWFGFENRTSAKDSALVRLISQCWELRLFRPN